jgi:hypothetical protein
MAIEPKPEFNYKPAFKLALLGNVLLLGIWVSFLVKKPVEAVPRLQTQQEPTGRVTQTLLMRYGESVKIVCQYPDGKPGAAIIVNRSSPTLYCTDVQNISPGNP